MSTCSHGVPRFFVCRCERAHPHERSHVCDDPPPRMQDLDSRERQIILALIDAGKAASVKAEAELPA